MTIRTCSICTRPLYAKGYCRPHYARFLKYGNPHANRPIIHKLIGASLEERFWPNVDTSGGDTACWLWKGSTDTAGYGQFWDRRTVPHKLKRTHRIAWELINGPIPDGLFVLHHCDNRLCCNPTLDTPEPHLFLGTQADNMEDMRRKNRHYGGPFAKLTAGDVREIRRLSATGIHYRELAEQFRVHRGSIGRIVRRDIWKHID